MAHPASMTAEERAEARAFVIPFDATAYAVNADYAVYFFQTTVRGNEYPGAVVFRSKSLKACIREYYPCGAERRQERIDSWISGLEKEKAEKARRRKDRNQPHSLKVGDVLRSSWGYDQTNIDYYEVVGLNGRTMVTLRGIAAKSQGYAWMQGESVPAPGQYIGVPSRHKVDGSNNMVRLSSFASASKMEPIAYAGGAPIFKASRWTAYA